MERNTASIYPAVFLSIVVACVVFYNISKSLNLQIQDELAERRKKYVGSGASA
jgi:Na+/melibiose symporter-like transporter